MDNSWEVEEFAHDPFGLRRGIRDHDDVAVFSHPLKTFLLGLRQPVWRHLEFDPDNPAVFVDAEIRQARFDGRPAHGVRMVVVFEAVPVKPGAKLVMDLAFERQVSLGTLFLGGEDAVGFSVFGGH